MATNNISEMNIILEIQENPIKTVPLLPCPRCGGDRMLRDPSKNAMSLIAKLHVCEKCSIEEAVQTASGNLQPVKTWAFRTVPFWGIDEILAYSAAENQ